ncbi:hypothetical protein E8A73_045105 [Polyangium aurulentum]|nr:hypothetical protein E8A73_045105 [Polyangium aurulentum]
MASCKVTGGPIDFSAGGSGPGPVGSGGSGGSGGSSMSGGGGEGGDISFIDAGSPTGTGGEAPTCTPKGPEDDVDGDGYTPNQGDCNDCDKNTNPNAVEVPTTEGDPHDENCDGNIDEPPPPPCDDALVIDTEEPLDAAYAVDLCKMSTGPYDWGLVSAQWVMADGSPPPPSDLVNFHLGHGMLTGFGPNITMRRGKHMLALSSGTARQPSDPGYQSVGGFQKGYQGGHPVGFPKESPACPGTSTGEPNDPTGVELTVRMPKNAYGFSFDFNFYTYEWPGYICSTFNDFFVALLSPFPMGQSDGNVSFDSQGNPVSVNNAFLEVCGCDGNPPQPCQAGGKVFQCALGNIDLIGTGFGFDTGGTDHASTGWLQTKAPAEPGSEIKIRFAVYDSGDGVLDTTTLVDNWQWIAKPGITPGTNPIPK